VPSGRLQLEKLMSIAPSRERIAYQGEPGAYSEAAALRFDPHAETVPVRTFEEVFAAVADGRATLGILPMENSIGGSIHRNYDLLLEHDLPIVGEVELRIEHCLLALPGVSLSDLRVIHSHPQALAQCERFLRGCAGVEIVAVYDTAGGARLVREGGLRHVGAIASRRAAEVFGLAILAEHVEDPGINVTRFVLVRRTPAPADEADKTTIVFALPSVPGALFKALSVFALRDINLTKLESRPIRGRPWEYLFYADLAVGRHELRCARALVHLAEFARWTKTLGSYRAWREPTPARASARGAIAAEAGP
jgi:arogenate/prephenate dehydratase